MDLFRFVLENATNVFWSFKRNIRGSKILSLEVDFWLFYCMFFGTPQRQRHGFSVRGLLHQPFQGRLFHFNFWLFGIWFVWLSHKFSGCKNCGKMNMTLVHFKKQSVFSYLNIGILGEQWKRSSCLGYIGYSTRQLYGDYINRPF